MSVRLRLLAAVLSTALVLMVMPRVSEAVHLLFKPATFASADLMVTKTGPAVATAGSDVSFTVNVTNLGSDDALNVSLTDSVPTGMGFVSFNQESGPAFSCSQSSGTITCTIATLPQSSGATFTFVMNIPANATKGTTFVNTAAATSTTPDPNPDNNAGTAEVRMPQGDLFVTKTGPASAPAGTDVSFDVTIINLGPDDAAGVILRDPIPAGMTFVSRSQNSGPAFDCSSVPAVGSGGTITCTIATLALNASANFTFVMHVPSDAPAGTTFTNIATASYALSSPSFDQNTENNSSPASVTIPGAASADLSVTKSAPPYAPPNSDVPFSIVITNGGPTPAANVSFSDTLPGTMTFVSIVQNSGPIFTCNQLTGTVTCTLATMDAGASATFTLTAHIPAGTGAGTEYSNTVTVSSTPPSTPDPNSENNSSTAVVSVSSVDISMTKTGPPTAVAGNSLTWTLTLTNVPPAEGPGQTAINATFVDQLPAGTTFVSLNHTGGTAPSSCDMPSPGQNGIVSCSVAALGTGASSQYTLTANISPNVPNGTAINNTATASSENGDPNPNNNSSTQSTTVSTAADVSVTKTDSPDPVIAGSNLTYSIAVSNSGPSDAANVELSDLLPPNTTFVSFSTPAGWTRTDSVPVDGTGTVKATTPSLAVGANAVFTLVVKVNSNTPAATQISNSAVVTSSTSDSSENNNQSTTTTTVNTSADVSVTKTDSPDPIIAGNNLTYTITATNNGVSDASTLNFADTLPPNTTLVSFTVPGGWTRTDVVPAGGTGTVTATATTLAAGASAQFTLVVNVNGNTPNNTVLTNSATVSATTSDSNPVNNTGTTTTTVTNNADLSITKSDAPDPVFAGNNITYTINFKNNGPATANAVTVTDAVPANTTFVSAVVTTGSGWTITTPPVGGTGNVVFSKGSVPDQETATLTVLVNVNSSTPNGAIITNSATATTTTSDPNNGNNTGTATTTVTNNADLSITKSDAPDPVLAGNNLTYTINFKNNGPLSANSVTVTDAVPANTTFVSAVVTTGSGWTITTPPVGGTGNVVFSKGSVPDQETATFTVAVNVNSSTPNGAIISNTAVAASATVDSDSNNNSATATTSVGSYPDLTITKSHSGNFSAGQVGATYIITVTNIGTGQSSGLVTVTDNVPVGLTPTGPNGAVGGWFCSINAQTLTCTRSDVLAGGASYPAISLTVTVANPAPLSVTNTATVSGGGEVNTNNNTASDPTTINCSANFALNNSSPLVISRFRENGPAGPQDEFIEIFNPTPIPHMVASGNCNGGGYGVYASAGNGTTSNTATMVCYIPNGTVIPAGGYYLCTGVTYSLGNLGRNGGAAGATATGDAPIGCGGTCGANIPDDAGLALVNKAAPTLPGGFGILEFGDVIYDKVGFGPYGPTAPATGYPFLALTYCEGGAAGCLKPVGDASTGAACANPSGLFPVFPAPPACYGLAGQYEFLRRQTTFDANQGTLHQDTNNNGNDFILVAPNPATNMGMAVTGVSGVTAVLGAAGPYNRNAPPDMPAVKLTRSPFDGTNQFGPLNAERRYIPDPTVANPANNPLGTYTLRFRYTNNSNFPITGLRFELDDLATLCGPQSPTPATASVGTGAAKNVGSTPGCGTGAFTAILKALNSTAEVIVDSGGTARSVNGTVLEDLSASATPAAPGAGPLSPNGGGIDSTFIINPSSDNASLGDGVTGGVGNFATTMGTSGPTKEIRVQVKFGVVRNGRFILLLVPMAKNSPAP